MTNEQNSFFDEEMLDVLKEFNRKNEKDINELAMKLKEMANSFDSTGKESLLEHMKNVEKPDFLGEMKESMEQVKSHQSLFREHPIHANKMNFDLDFLRSNNLSAISNALKENGIHKTMKDTILSISENKYKK